MVLLFYVDEPLDGLDVVLLFFLDLPDPLVEVQHFYAQFTLHRLVLRFYQVDLFQELYAL